MCHVPNPSSPRHHSRRPYTTYRLIVWGVGEERPPLGQSADSGGGESRSSNIAIINGVNPYCCCYAHQIGF